MAGKRRRTAGTVGIRDERSCRCEARSLDIVFTSRRHARRRCSRCRRLRSCSRRNRRADRTACATCRNPRSSCRNDCITALRIRGATSRLGPVASCVSASWRATDDCVPIVESIRPSSRAKPARYGVVGSFGDATSEHRLLSRTPQPFAKRAQQPEHEPDKDDEEHNNENRHVVVFNEANFRAVVKEGAQRSVNFTARWVSMGAPDEATTVQENAAPRAYRASRPAVHRVRGRCRDATRATKPLSAASARRRARNERGPAERLPA